MTDPWLFTAAVLALLAAPGPTNILLATAGAIGGRRRMLPLLAAELLGYFCSIAIIRTVLVPLLTDRPEIEIAIKLGLAAYLLWLAFRLWSLRLDIGHSEDGGAAQGVGLRSVFLATLLNPKCLIVALTLVPWTSAGTLFFLAIFAGLVLATGTAWLALGVVAGKAASRRISWLPRISAVILTGFAGVVAASAA